MAGQGTLEGTESQAAGAFKQRSATMQLLSLSLNNLEPNIVFGLPAQDPIRLNMFETNDSCTITRVSRNNC